MRIKIYILSAISALFSLNTLAQKADSISAQKVDTSAIIREFMLNKESKLPGQVAMDTFMLPFHYYNPIFDSSFSNTFLGNTGQAAESNIFYKRNPNLRFMFSQPYQAYLYTPFNTPHFNTRKPYTELKYISSGARDNSEQVLSALHTQNINQYANVGILYDVIASKGVYLHQQVGNSRLNLFGSYEKDRYSLFASLNINSIHNLENGGLVNLDNFLSHQANELNYRVFFNNAKSRFKNTSLFVTQKLNLENVRKDSSKTHKAERFVAQHTISYNRTFKVYSDQIPESDTISFYRNYYYLNGQAYDSAFYGNLANRLDLSMRFAGQSQELRVYLKHEYKTFSYILPQPVSYDLNALVVDTVVGDNIKKSYNDLSVGGQFKGSVGNWAYKTSGYFYLTGYRQSDLLADAEFTRYLSHKTRHVSLYGRISSLKPSYFQQNYGSSHFIWSNNFKNTDNIEVQLLYNSKDNFSTRIALNYLTGYIYFDSLAMPAQISDQVVVASMMVYKRFDWGPVHQIHRILLQKPTVDDIHLPLLAYGNTTFYQNQVFSGALKFQVGFDFYYFLKYYADAYMPATGMFFNQTTSMIGEYPYLNAFINWRIKRTRFTLQYTNALAGIAGYNYFMAYRYPNFNGSLKFGLAWTFYD
ncbi:MAG TPA: putative porin [Bacteroidales bacterium]|nr:putative porin [Bacteroidales bacterium]